MSLTTLMMTRPRHRIKANSPNPWVYRFQGGAGWLPGDSSALSPFPDFFKSLADLLMYFEITVATTLWGAIQVYSLNGVSPNTAVLVCPGSGSIGYTSFYMAPAQAGECWYYLINWLGAAPNPNVGPTLTAAQAQKAGVSYVGISAEGPGNPVACAWGLPSPDPSKFTLIG